MDEGLSALVEVSAVELVEVVAASFLEELEVDVIAVFGLARTVDELPATVVGVVELQAGIVGMEVGEMDEEVELQLA